MSSIQINFVIASEDPFELAKFYAKFNADKVFEGLSSAHYFISLSNRSKIHFYRPSKKRPWPKRGEAVSLCFQKDSCTNSKLCLEEWISDLILLGAKPIETLRDETFGSEVWMKDPEGNKFLLLIQNDCCFDDSL